MFSVGSAADSITLKNGNSLSGELMDSDTLGIITLNHPHSKEPIKIRETSVERIVFQKNKSSNIVSPENIYLLNGDYFPCNITELTDKIVSFKSDSIGSHTIPRNAVSKIKFNLAANKLLYEGPGNNSRVWKSSSNSWKLNDNTLSSRTLSQGTVHIPNLTDNYILEFKTAWEGPSPQLRVCFSCKSKKIDKNNDYYYIDLNANGLAIRRSLKGKFKSLAQIPKNRTLYSKSSLHVAIRVDRKNKKLALYLNDKLVKTFSDSQPPPTGSYLIIKNLRQGPLAEVSRIKVSSWLGKVSENSKSKKLDLSKHDLITDLTGNIISGQIIGLSQTDGKTSLNFKAPFAKGDSKIPGSVIDHLEFKTPAKAPHAEHSIYSLNLLSGGRISFSSSQMTNGQLTLKHPTLGNISLPKADLLSVYTNPKPSVADEVEIKDATQTK